MKKIYTILLALAALLAVGCTRELAEERQDGDIHIRIAVDGLETKAAGTSEENAVNSLHVFVYKSDESTVLYYTHVSSPTFAAGKSYYEQTTNLAGLAGSPTEDEVKNAVVYAIANYNGTTSIAGTESLATLQALEVDASKFATPSPFVMTARGGFTSGGGNVTVASLQLKRLATKVTLKLNFPATTCTTKGSDPTFGKTTTTWTPMTDGTNFKSMLQNAVGNSKLDGSAAAAPDVFSYNTQKLTNLSTGVYSSADFYTYPVSWTAGSEDEPFVKVVLSWSYVTTADSDGSEVDRNVVERYYKIVFSGLSELAANTWYQPEVTLKVLPGEGNEPVLVIPEGLQVQPWGLVGGTDPSADPIPDVAVTDAKFITVSAADLMVDRGATASFEVLASGPVTMTLKNIYHTKYITMTKPTSLTEVGTNTDGNYGRATEYIVKENVVQPIAWEDSQHHTADQWVTFEPDLITGKGGTIKLVHTLSSDINNPDFAVTAYSYDVTLSLDGVSPAYEKQITIVQNPSVKVTNQLSKAYVFVDAKSNRSWNTDYSEPEILAANVVYPTNKSNATAPSKASKHLYTIIGPNLNVGGYKNMCVFRFLFDVVPFKTGIYVTDTRVSVTNSSPLEGEVYKVLTKSGKDASSTNAPITTSGYASNTASSTTMISGTAASRTVNYKAATDHPDYISPQFVICSSYANSRSQARLGLTEWYGDFGKAVLRCATYQEDGYPAGRWRLPTEAELAFIMEIQGKGFIPTVAVDRTWASSGRVLTVVGSSYSFVNTTYTGNSVRCVYDTWYWGTEDYSSTIDGDRYEWGGFVPTK